MPQNPVVRMSPSGPILDVNPSTLFDPLTLTYYVDAGYSGGSSNGSIAQPFTTIQEGATALGDVNAGALIVVPKGDATPYAEDVVFGTGAFSIQGTNQDHQNLLQIQSVEVTSGVLNLVNVQVAGVLMSGGSGLVSAENSVFTGAPAIDTPGGVTLIECDVAGEIVALGNVTLTDTDANNNIDCGGVLSVRGAYSTSGGVLSGALCQQLIARNTILDGDFEQQNATGGGGSHSNPAWQMYGCEFGSSMATIAMVGQSLDAYFDDASLRNFYAAGASNGNALILENSAITCASMWASSEANTSDTSGDALFHIVVGADFLTNLVTPWNFTAEAGIIRYLAAYVGPGSPPPSPPLQVKVTLTASVRANAGDVYCGIALDQDLAGDDPTATFSGIGATQITTNGDLVNITAQRVIDLTGGALQEIQAVYALIPDAGASDVTIIRQNMIVEPIKYSEIGY